MPVPAAGMPELTGYLVGVFLEYTCWTSCFIGVSSIYPKRDLCMSYFHCSLEFFPYMGGAMPAGLMRVELVSTRSKFQTPVMNSLKALSFSPIAALMN